MTKTCTTCGTEHTRAGLLCTTCRTELRAKLAAYRAPIIAEREADRIARRESATAALRYAANMGA